MFDRFQFVIALLPITFVACMAASPAAPPKTQPASQPAAAPFENEIKAFEAADARHTPAPGGILFIGSSSIRRWTTLTDDFPGLPVLNRGFGGSIIAQSTYYAPRIVFPYQPRIIVFFAGDNDLARGNSAEMVLHDFQRFAQVVREHLPRTRIFFISIKPSPSRAKLIETQQKANQLVRSFIEESKTDRLRYIDIVPAMLGSDGKVCEDLFGPDRLHMNEKGYERWTSILTPILKEANAAP